MACCWMLKSQKFTYRAAFDSHSPLFKRPKAAQHAPNGSESRITTPSRAPNTTMTDLAKKSKNAHPQDECRLYYCLGIMEY
ncbi:hypothetical protein OUZ56_029995 [Daphnia magna]|uniref:Uncharacterized protein n=1 Tax=Daphnia magna TaxID=35525 RepID=A0ABR0B8E6_9CRUS|nr:hypothetical protein OUZ56_029995 [Daphnia magna]